MDVEEENQHFINHPPSWYQYWHIFMLVLAFLCTWLASVAFSFLEVLPTYLLWSETIEIFFFADWVLQIVIACKYGTSTHTIWRCVKSYGPSFIAFIPWVYICNVLGRNIVLRLLILLRMYRLPEVFELYSRMKNYQFRYMSSKARKFVAVNAFIFHVAACIFFYSAISWPSTEDTYTWIGHDYEGFRNMQFWFLYGISVYFAATSVHTVGYGDLHPQNLREMCIAVILFLTLIYVAIDFLGDRDEKEDEDSAACGQEYREHFRRMLCPRCIEEGPPNDCSPQFHDDTSFINFFDKCINDGSKVFSNLAKITRNYAHTRKKEKNDPELEKFIRRDTNMNKKDGPRKTPLHVAAAQGYADMIEILIESGEEVNAIDDLGNTPILEAIRGRHVEIVKFLLDKGANLMIGDAGSVLCSFVANDDVKYVKWLLHIGMDPNSEDKDKNNPYAVAAKQGFFAMMQLFESQGEKDRQGNTTDDKVDEGDTDKHADKEHVSNVDAPQSKILSYLYKRRDKEALSFPYNLGHTTYTTSIDFWERIYCDNDDYKERGWLCEDHIDIWAYILLKTKRQASFTIMPVHFMSSTDIMLDTWINHAKGQYDTYPAWSTVDLVLLPINYQSNHWLIASLDLKTWKLTFYDSLDPKVREKWVGDIVQNFDINKFLDLISYWDMRGQKYKQVKLDVEFAKNALKQKNNFDCGVCVCIWLEALCTGDELNIEEDKIKAYCVKYRAQMADAIWTNRGRGNASRFAS